MHGISYRPDIDGLRTMAVLPVVLNHAGIPGFPGGFVGVDVFFVISGFLITRILAREIVEERFSIVAFYERRARRILPALFAVIAACLIAGWFLLFPFQYEALARSAQATLLFSSNIWFWLGAQDYFGDGVKLDPLLHTWSLSVEEQFYVFFPLLLFAMASRSRRTWILVIAGLSLLSAGLSFAATEHAPIAGFFLTPMRIWELGLGALLAIGAVPAVRSRAVAEIAGAAGLLLIAASIALITEDTPFPGLTALFPCLGAAAVIWAGMSGQSLAGRLLSLPPMVWIGLISYSVYLWHWPVLVAARLAHNTPDLPMPVALACVAASLLLGWASWQFIERPFRTSPGKGLSRRGIFAASGAGAAVLLGAAVSVTQLDGLQSRFSDDMAVILEAKERSPLEVDCFARDAEQPPCRLGATAGEEEIDVIVWGDSHAGAMLPGIDSWLSANGMAGAAFTKSACPPLPGVLRVDKEPGHRCDAHNDKVLAFIKDQKGPQTVIIAARWALAAEGSRAPGEDGKPAILGASDGTVQGAGNAAVLKNSLLRLLDDLQSSGKKAVIVEGVPEIGFRVPEAIVRQSIFGDQLPQTVTLAGYEERNRRANAILAEAARGRGAELVSLSGIMCPSDCLIEKDGAPLYRDDDHLSVAGAQWLMPLVLDMHLRPAR